MCSNTALVTWRLFFKSYTQGRIAWKGSATDCSNRPYKGNTGRLGLFHNKTSEYTQWSLAFWNVPSFYTLHVADNWDPDQTATCQWHVTKRKSSTCNGYLSKRFVVRSLKKKINKMVMSLKDTHMFKRRPHCISLHWQLCCDLCRNM